MAGRRRNPLALAVLTLLREGPRHPYEIASTLRERHKHESIRLNYGNLYATVDRLLADGFVEIVDTGREGRRPERTTYAITAAGQQEMTDWLAALVAEPHKEYPDFEAALSLLPALPPDLALELLDVRVRALDSAIAANERTRSMVRVELDLPEIFWIELDYNDALVRAERDVVARLAASIADGTLGGIGLWRTFHDGDGIPRFDPDWRALDKPARPTPRRPAPASPEVTSPARRAGPG